MRNYFVYILLFFSVLGFSQPITAASDLSNGKPNEQLAQNYFDRGEFSKAILVFESLVKSQPNNYLYFQKQVACYQQLVEFDKAENVILARIEKTRQPNLYIELGYNYQLQKENPKANKYYKLALEKVKENPNNVYTVARDFEQKVLVQEAIEAYNLEIGRAHV